MRIVVSDTGPLLHLLEIDEASILPLLGTISIPDAVRDELDVHYRRWAEHAPFIGVESLGQSASSAAKAWITSGTLHPGEAESLVLAQQIKCDWYLTDDAAARIAASSVGLEVHGTVGIALWTAATGVVPVDRARVVLQKLSSQSTLWLTAKVLAEAKSALNEIASRR